MASLAELAADMADAELLLSKATRPKVKALMTEYLTQLREEYMTRSSSRTAAAPAQAAAAEAGDSRPIADQLFKKDSYGKDPSYVYVYCMSGLDGVGDIKDRVSCEFTKSSFDLKILGYNGKNLRLFKNNLDKEILPEESKAIVKKNKVTIKMRKPKGQYGSDHWSDLTQKRPALDGEKKKDPGDSLMDMMKDMYDNGDDQMKKTLGEAMLKSRENQAQGKTGMDDFA